MIQLYNAWLMYSFSKLRSKSRFPSLGFLSLVVIIVSSLLRYTDDESNDRFQLALIELVAALITGAECFRIQHLSLLPIRAIKTCAVSSLLCVLLRLI